MTAMARPNPAGREAGKDSYDDDPLVELARIVSGRAKSADIPQQSAFREDSGMTEADLARDLETELLNDLQATFAGGNDETTEYYGEPAAYSDGEDYGEPADQAYGYRGEGFDERDDRPAYRGREPGADLPPLPGAEAAGHDFSHFNLRNDRGPAYNPHSLSAEEYAEDYADEEPAPRQHYAADLAEEQPAPRQQYAEDYAEEEPLLDPAREIAQASAFPEDDTFADPADWDFDPHPHVAEVAAGTAEPSYFDSAGIYDQDEVAPVAPRAQVRHRDPRLDADPLGQARYRRRRGIRLFPILGVLMIIGLGAAFVLVFRNGGTASEPVFVAADASPTRIFPEPEPTATEPENLVFNRLNPDAPPPDETLLEPTEPVADLAARPEANDGITQILTPTDPATADAVDLPRMVRTVTVLTDGTIVENETAPAAGATPAAPAAAATPAPEPPAADPVPANTDPIAVAAIDPPAAETPPALLTVPTETMTPPPPAPQAVANLPRAGDPIAPGFYVQVTAQASEQAAQTQLQDFRARAPGLLGTRPAIIQRAELDQGIFYRVKFGPFATRPEAVTLVENLRAIGMDGFIADHQ